MYINIFVSTYIYICNLCIQKCMYIHVPIYINICMYIYMYIYAYIHIYMYIHRHLYTYVNFITEILIRRFFDGIPVLIKNKNKNVKIYVLNY
jgi:hypothetical protein